MVDERDVAVAAASPLAASGEAGDGAEVPEAEGEAQEATSKSSGGAAASPPPPPASGAPRAESAQDRARSGGLGDRGAADDELERRLKAGSRSSSVCPPLWKVRPSAACPFCTRSRPRS
jgi:hypothetical protein